MLRQFDMNMYGPCIEMTRIKGSEHERKHGLNYLHEIKILLKIGKVESVLLQVLEVISCDLHVCSL